MTQIFTTRRNSFSLSFNKKIIKPELYFSPITEVDTNLQDNLYGWFTIRPDYLQNVLIKHHGIWPFLVFLSSSAFIEGFAVNGLINVCVSSIERQFHLNSLTTGFIVSAYDISFLIFAIPVSFLGGQKRNVISLESPIYPINTLSKVKYWLLGNKIIFLSFGMLTLGFGSLIFTLPQFISPSYLSQLNLNFELDNFTLCTKSSYPNNIKQLGVQRLQGTIPTNFYVSLFFIGNFLHGFGSCPLYTIGLTYIDENTTADNVSLAIGIYYAISVIGPAFGYFFGAYSLNKFVDLWKTPIVSIKLRPTDSNWVGAWWLGFVISSILSWIICIPLSGFPKHFPNMRQKFLRRDKQSFQTLKDVVSSTANTSGKFKCKTPTITTTQSISIKSRPAVRAEDFVFDKEPNLFKSRNQSEETLISYLKSFWRNNYDKDESSNNEGGYTKGETRRREPNPEGQIQILNKNDRSSTLSSTSPYNEFEMNNHPEEYRTQFDATTPVDSLSGEHFRDKCLKSSQPSPNQYQVEHEKITLKSHIYSLFRNPVFMFLTLGGALDGLLLNGFAAFLPKYLEMQFDVTAERASLFVGVITIPAGMFGMFLGGYIIKRFTVNVKGMLKIVFYASVINFVCMFILIIYCPENKLVGLNTKIDKDLIDLPDLQSTLNISQKSQTNLKPYFKNTCNSRCNCDFKFKPICSQTSGLTYYSACYAGCKYFNNFNTTTQMAFKDCSCQHPNKEFDEILYEGKCPISCKIFRNIKTPSTRIMIGCFLGIMFVALFLLLMIAVVSVNITLNTVERHENSIAMGIQWVFVRLLGTIPGPIIFGKIIDLNCLLWEETSSFTTSTTSIAHDSNDLESRGSCQLYNNRNMALSLLFLSIVCKTLAQTFYGLSYYYYYKYYKIYQTYLANIPSPSSPNTR